MSATDTRTPEALRRDLEHLQSLACDVVCAEERLATFAKLMQDEARWDSASALPYYSDAVAGGVKGAVSDALEPRSGPSTPIVSGFLIAQECQDSLDVLDMAIKRRDEERPEAVAS